MWCGENVVRIAEDVVEGNVWSGMHSVVKVCIAWAKNRYACIKDTSVL